MARRMTLAMQALRGRGAGLASGEEAGGSFGQVY